jgi:excisionase family DNA binding protein
MLTVKEAAQRLEVSPERVRNMIYDGVLPAERYGRSWLIADEAVWERLHRRPKAGRPRKDAVNGSRKGTGASNQDDICLTNRPPGFNTTAARRLYSDCKRQLYGCYDIDFLDQARSEEERLFYTTVADFFLQQRQRELIAQRVF